MGLVLLAKLLVILPYRSGCPCEFPYGCSTVKLVRSREQEKVAHNEALRVERREVGMFIRVLPVTADLQLYRVEHGAG
jgi:hypothetical protein